MMDTAIRASGLAKSYHRRSALAGIDLEVPQGIVFGYLGPNGAGKTTTIRLLAGLIRPTSGRAEVFGFDTVRHREQAQAKIGYLPGEFVAYADLTGRQYLDYLANLRDSVTPSTVDDLVGRLGIDLSQRIGTLSHGNRQKLGIVQAFMHEPEVLVLDEPTSGLDPLVQREFLAMVREARQRGQTVFLSSHVLYEVEAVADAVGILSAGRLVAVESVEGLKAQALRRIELTFAGPPPIHELQAVGSVREANAAGQTAHLLVEGSTADLFKVASPHGIEQVVTHEPDLEQIFMSYYGQVSEK